MVALAKACIHWQNQKSLHLDSKPLFSLFFFTSRMASRPSLHSHKEHCRSTWVWDERLDWVSGEAEKFSAEKGRRDLHYQLWWGSNGAVPGLGTVSFLKPHLSQAHCFTTHCWWSYNLRKRQLCCSDSCQTEASWSLLCLKGTLNSPRRELKLLNLNWILRVKHALVLILVKKTCMFTGYTLWPTF